MNSVPCDIVLLPNDELAQKAITLSAALQTYAPLFQLSTTGPFPHASLYMTQLKVADLDKVKELLQAIATQTPTLDLLTIGYDQAEGYVDANYARTAILGKLQMEVVHAINPIRDGMREKDKARMLTLVGQERENLEKYGYRAVGELFRPHITFTRFANGQSIDTADLPQSSDFNGRFTKIGLFEMGDNGTCAREIATFELG